MAAADGSYLSQKNISTVIQWLTAELIKNEPENPLAFIHEITGQNCKNADVESLLGESIKGVSAAKLRTNLDGISLENVSRCISEISHFHTDDPEAVDSILSKINELTQSKCFLHLVDPDAEKMMIRLGYGDEQIVIPFGTGIVGQVAESCVAMTKENDDVTTKFYGENIGETCACPLFNTDREIIGVVQCFEKEDGIKFTPQDVLVLSIFCSAMTVFLTGNSTENKTDMRALVDLLETVRAARHTLVPISSLIFTITRRTAEMIGTDRCTLFVVDPVAQQMWSMQGEINIRIPINAGIAGSCATSGEIINIEDAYKDDRFNAAFDKKSGYHTKTILCIPMKLQDGEVVGVLQLINKLDGVFTDDDAKLLTLILEDAATTFSKIESFQKGLSGPEMPDDMLDIPQMKSGTISRRGSKNNTLLPLIEENGDLEEDMFEDLDPPT